MNSVTFPARVIFALVAGWVSAPQASAEERPELGRFFEGAKVVGTFVSRDVKTNVTCVHNPARATRRFVPASTFKIVNSLIALETKAVATVDEVVPFGGKPQRLKIWEQDMPLREAIRVSNVPVYQEVARRIGLARMAAYIRNFSYGNGDIGQVVDRFWLDGPLEISALEQADFLARLATGKLSVSAPTLDAVKEITLLERTKFHRLHAKTGWADEPDPDIGWWVGWIERDTGIVSFALNLEIQTDDDAPNA